MQKVSKSQFTSSAVWKMLETFASKGITFIVSLVLARLLSPSDYGIIAITGVFTSLTDIFIQGGFNTAIIQKKTVDDDDYSTTFIFSLGIATALYLILFFSSPAIAAFYQEAQLVDVLRVLGIVLFAQAFSSVRVAKITREMQFKLMCICNLIACAISGVIGIVMARLGYGVWALVGQQISFQLILNLILFLKLDFKFHLRWSRTHFTEMFGFSMFVFLSALMSYLGDNITNVAVGKIYSVEVLGFLSKGDQFPRQLSIYTFGAISSVLLPTFASYKDNPIELKRVTRRILRMTCYIIFPLMLGMVSTARPLIVLLLTDKWLPSVEIMQYACIYYAALPISLVLGQLLYGIRKGRERVVIELVRLVLMTLALVVVSIVMHRSIVELMMVRALITLFIAVLYIALTIRILNYSTKEILYDIGRPLLASAVIAVAAYAIVGVVHNLLLTLVLAVAISGVLYLLLSRLFKIQEYQEIFQLIRKWKNRERAN
ncbi:MAG: lipopolysaccharide biosynthesis protein [Eubacteriales bacterium]|nr:lipopolysaccharide biosynthesis protein [Eubacteriales bacterium]